MPNSTINMAKYQSDNNKSLITEKDNMFRVELFRVNPITDQANQATNQDFERLDFFSCLYSRFTCKFREISYSHKIKLE